jgi:isopentenyl-diphosphate delta-isomerase
VNSPHGANHSTRKEEHIDLCANQDVEHSKRDNGFSSFVLPHVALPGLNWSDLDTSRLFLGKQFSSPFLITGMTGGLERAAQINENLARVAETYNIPMGVGSQRIALEEPKHADIFELKRKFPKLFLIGNIGIGQLDGKDDLDLCNRAIDMIRADALAIHINVLQELIQPEGDRNFRNTLDYIGNLVNKIRVPLIVKEVGAGMDTTTVQNLYSRGVRAIDVGGKGGTSWAYIEGLRAKSDHGQRLGKTFRDFGISTADALISAHDLKLPGLELIATGGMRDGLTALKAIKIGGARMVGFGLPLFKAALLSSEKVSQEIEILRSELKVAMMCTSTKDLRILI